MANYSSNDKRFDQLREALIKLSQYNFSYRIPISDTKNREDTLALLINHVSLKMNQLTYQIRTEKTLYSEPKLFIMLDSEQNIITHTDENFSILLENEQVMKLAQCLSAQSKKRLVKLWKKISQKRSSWYDFGVLDFRAANGLIFPLHLRILKFTIALSTPMYLLFAFDPEEPLPALSQKEATPPGHNEIPRIEDVRNVRDFFLAKKIFNILKDYRHRRLPALDQIAYEAASSKSRIKRVFKKFYHYPIRTYDMKMRLEESLILLQQTDMNVKEISEHFGFQLSSHYSKRFKREYGVSPTQYRKNLFKNSTLYLPNKN